MNYDKRNPYHKGYKVYLDGKEIDKKILSFASEEKGFIRIKKIVGFHEDQSWGYGGLRDAEVFPEYSGLEKRFGNVNIIEA